MIKILRNIKKFFITLRNKHRFDSYIIWSMLILILIGIITQSTTADQDTFQKHLLYLFLGIPVFYLGYKFPLPLLKNFSWLIYLLSIGFLLWVNIYGSEALGAQRWIRIGGFSMQPSEIAKIASIIMLSTWFSARPIKKFTDMIIGGLLISFIPFVLIFIQPDLGTSLVLIAIFAVISFWSGATSFQLFLLFSPLLIMLLSVIGHENLNLGSFSVLNKEIKMTCSYLGLFSIAIISAFVFYKLNLNKKKYGILFLILFTSFSLFLAFLARPLAWNILKDYQQTRLIIFLNPEQDSQGAGYNIIQSLLAVGSGRLLGQGYKHGPLTQGDFVPEQHTDFAFSSIGEEWGLIGCTIVLICFMIICIRLLSLTARSNDSFERLLLSGIFALIFFHFSVNISMNIGLLPVIGVPLPFISYGGTAIWICLFLMGISQNIFSKNRVQAYY